MLVHPDLARLREGLPAQPRTDAVLAAWQADEAVAPVIAQIALAARGAGLGTLPELARLLHDHTAAAALTAGLIGPLLEALRAEPLAQLPFGHSTAPGCARLRLAASGRAALTLSAHACRAGAQPASALFEDGIAHEIVIAGQGLALFHRLDRGRLLSAPITLTPGTRLESDGPKVARQIIAVTQPLLVLQFTGEAAAPQPSREIALDDGRLIKTISGCKATSQAIMALNVLGALGHGAAVPAMAALAQNRSAASDLRWEALRHALALDTRAGLGVLAGLAGDPADPLSRAAAALQRQLAATRPDLAALLEEPA